MTTLTIALSQFDLANRADGLAAKTLSWYRWLLHENPHSLSRWFAQEADDQALRDEHGDMLMKNISTHTLREYIVWLRQRRHSVTNEPLTVETINDYIRALHRFFSWSSAEYGIPNPMKRITYPKSKQQQPKAIEMDDLRKMFASCGDDVRGARAAALMAFMIDTGARAAEVCGLLTAHVQLDERKAVVTGKGNKTRAVLFTTRTAELLRQWYALRLDVPNVFYNLQSTEPLTVSGLRQVLEGIAARASVTGRVNPHSFRHAFAREYILAGGDLATLSRLMGHNEQSTTTGFYALFTEQEIADKHERYSPMSQLFDKKTG